MKIKKLGALLVSAALCAGMAAPAFAFEGEAAPVEQPVLPEVVEEDVVTVTDETAGALTPEGNLTLVDDYHTDYCNGVQREHNKKLNNGLPILHKVPPKRDYGRYFCIMAEKGGTSHGGLTEKLSPFFHAKKQEVNAYGR